MIVPTVRFDHNLRMLLSKGQRRIVEGEFEISSLVTGTIVIPSTGVVNKEGDLNWS